jgi:hypothetical protein
MSDPVSDPAPSSQSLRAAVADFMDAFEPALPDEKRHLFNESAIFGQAMAYLVQANQCLNPHPNAIDLFFGKKLAFYLDEPWDLYGFLVPRPALEPGQARDFDWQLHFMQKHRDYFLVFQEMVKVCRATRHKQWLGMEDVQALMLMMAPNGGHHA